MEWRDKACFEAHIATPHVKHAEDRLKRGKMLVEPAKEWHFYPLIKGPQGRGYKKL
jgi:quinol monooxygenase YgiN